MTRPRILLVIWLLVPVLNPIAAQPDPDPARFASEIEVFVRTDASSRPQGGGILFVGSSSIRMWNDLETMFEDLPVIRRGFGGSEFSDLLHFADRIVFPYEPRKIVVYEGDNDITNGKDPARVYGDLREFVGRVRERLPATQVGFIAIKPSPARWHLREPMMEVNQLIHEQAERDSMLVYLDIWTPMLDENGEPRPHLFIDDKLHLSADGYALWRDVVAPFVYD